VFPKSGVRHCASIVLLAGIILNAAMPDGRAGERDPHAVYETACARCHSPHAAEFFRERLIPDGDAVVIGRNREEFEAFLSGGHVPLSQKRVASLMDLAARVVQEPPLYGQKCRICHAPAVMLARRELLLRDGRLVGRYTGREIAGFLSAHGRLHGEETAQIVNMLRWQLETVSGYRTSGTER